MKQLTIYFITLFQLSLSAQDFGATLLVSNPIRDTQVSWFDIDNESFDNYNVKDRSYAVGILGFYKVNASTLRVRLNKTKINIEEYHDLYLTGTRDYTSVKGQQKKLTIAPGISWNVSESKLKVYFGFEIPLTLHGKFTLTQETLLSDSITNTLISDSYRTSVIPKGYSIGIGGLFGFTYFLHPNLSIGAEASPSLLYARLAGKTSGNYSWTTPPPGQSNSITTEDGLEGYTFFENRFSIALSIWFGGNKEQ
jgi:hypothetical protein